MILVDTSVIVDFLRGIKTREVELLSELELTQEPYLVPAICAQEVLQGAKTSRDWKLLVEYFSSLELLSSKDPQTHHFDAARIYFDCRRKGITVRGTIDCQIAQLAIEYKASLLQSDSDYKKIARVRELDLL